MGGACSSISEAMGMEVPEIEVDEGKVQEIVEKNGKKIAKKANANYKKFPKETEKCGQTKPPVPFEVPEVPEMTLEHGKAEKKDFVRASVLSASGGTAKDEIADEVWEEMKPELEGQLPPDLPGAVKNKALNKCRDKVVRPMVAKSIDKMLEKIIERMNKRPDNEVDGDDDDDEKDDKETKK
jgi:hypothetical protein